jgi:hypothetical protein
MGGSANLSRDVGRDRSFSIAPGVWFAFAYARLANMSAAEACFMDRLPNRRQLLHLWHSLIRTRDDGGVPDHRCHQEITENGSINSGRDCNRTKNLVKIKILEIAAKTVALFFVNQTHR